MCVCACNKYPLFVVDTHKMKKSAAVAQMGDRLATTDMGRKVGGAAVSLSVVRELGPHLTQCRLGRGLPPYQVAS